MADSSKERVEAIQQAARDLLEKHHDITQPLDLAKRRALAKTLSEQVACNTETAKRHITKALLRARGEWSKQRGGTRPGSGRPVKDDEERREAEHLERLQWMAIDPELERMESVPTS